MPRYTPKTKHFVMPDLIDRFGLPFGNPPDGYVVTFSGIDGYYYPKPTSKLQTLTSPGISPYTILTEDVVLVQTHAGTFTVNLPPYTTIAVASNGQALPQATINVASTTGFPTSGTIRVTTNTGVQTVTYSGTTGTTFTGCSGGGGTMSTGGAVTTTTPPAIGYSVVIKDFAGVALANPISVEASALIDGISTYSINANYSAIRVVWNGATWSILTEF